MKTLIRITVAIVILAAAIALVRRLHATRQRSTDASRFHYNLGNTDKVDPSLMIGREIATFHLSMLAGKPTAIAVADDDRILVADTDSACIILTPDGKLLQSLQLPAAANCLAVTADGDLLVGSGDQVLRLSTNNGELLSSFSIADHGGIITALAPAADDTVFIAVARGPLVLHCRADGSLIKVIGKNDVKTGTAAAGPRFIVPSPYFDLLLSGDDSLWVVNPGRHALENYRLDGSLRTSWQRSSMRVEDFSGCCNPTHIAELSNGALVTSEKGLVRVKLYREDGEFLGVIASPAQFDAETTGLDLAVDSRDRIMILDPARRQVRIFTVVVKGME